jgi:CRISPR/Cas system CSM-associated protein Csm3 (group 7 of RAMP superfamily)
LSGHDFFAAIASGSHHPRGIDAYTRILTYLSQSEREEYHDAVPALQKEITDPRADTDLLRLMDSFGLRSGPPRLDEDIPLDPVAVLTFEFTLEKPYASRDDAPFYPTDNPVRKDHVFRVPMVAPSSWKGSLRSAAVDLLILRDSSPLEKAHERMALAEIFGNEKSAGSEDWDQPRERSERDNLSTYLDRKLGPESVPKFRKLYCARVPQAEQHSDEIGLRGRLHFLPSFFDKIAVNTLNPRKRKTRTGTQPIHIEVVPPGAKAVFAVTWVAFDLIGAPQDRCRAALQRDWSLIGPALVRMFRETGFGAKKSSGYARASAAISNFRFENWLCGGIPSRPGTMDELAALAGQFQVAR